MSPESMRKSYMVAALGTRANWIAAQHASMTDTFITYGDPVGTRRVIIIH